MWLTLWMHWKDINCIRMQKYLFLCHLNVQEALQTESKYNSKSCIVHFRETPNLWCGWNLYWVYWAILTDHHTNTVQLSPPRPAVRDLSSRHKRLCRGLDFFIVRSENRPTIRRLYACTVNLPWKWNYVEKKRNPKLRCHIWKSAWSFVDCRAPLRLQKTRRVSQIEDGDVLEQ